MPLTLLVALLATTLLAAVSLVALLSATRARWFALVLTAGTALLPFALPREQTVLRFLFALGAIAAHLRGIELVRLRGAGLSPARRVFHAVMLPDSRKIRPGRSGPVWHVVATMLAYTAVGLCAGYVVARVAPRYEGALHWALRWGAGLVAFYCAAGASGDALIALFRVANYRDPDLYRTPVAARTFGEFWAVRWNHPVSAWLNEHVFTPLARRRRAGAGLAASFVVSALIHTYLALPLASVAMVASMGAFFLLQGALVAFERAVRMARRPRWVGHVWFVTVMAATSPMFIEPLLRFVPV